MRERTTLGSRSWTFARVRGSGQGLVFDAQGVAIQLNYSWLLDFDYDRKLQHVRICGSLPLEDSWSLHRYSYVWRVTTRVECLVLTQNDHLTLSSYSHKRQVEVSVVRDKMNAQGDERKVKTKKKKKEKQAEYFRSSNFPGDWSSTA